MNTYLGSVSLDVVFSHTMLQRAGLLLTDTIEHWHLAMRWGL